MPQTSEIYPSEHHSPTLRLLQICGGSGVQASGQRFTPLRRQVFSIIAATKRPITAYAILGQLLRQGRDAGPPTVYRTLDFLQQQRLVHRVESLNAFVACNHPDERHSWQFLICVGCGETLEIEIPRCYVWT